MVSFEAPNDPDVSGTHWKDLLSRMLVKHSALRCLLCCGVLSWVFSCHGFLHGRGSGVRRGPLLHSLWLLPSHKGCWDLFINNALRQWAWIAWSNRYCGRTAICVCFSNAREHHHFWYFEQYRLAFGLTCIIPNLRIKSVSYENDLFFRLYRDWMNKWGLDGPRVAETLFAWHLAAFVPPDLVRPISQFVSFAAALSGDPGISGRLAGFADYDYGFCSRTRGISQKLMKTRGQSESARGAVPRVLRGGFLSLPSLRLYRGLTIPRLSHPVPWFSQQVGQNWRNGKKIGQALKLEGVEIVNMFFVCAEGSLGHVGTWVYCVCVCVCLSYFLKWLSFGTTFVGFVTRPWILITYTDTCRTSDHLLYLLLMSSVWTAGNFCCNNVG